MTTLTNDTRNGVTDGHHTTFGDNTRTGHGLTGSHTGHTGTGITGTGNGYNTGYGAGRGYDGGDYNAGNATVFLRPIAAPSVLGLASYAGSTWIVSSYIANWWGRDASPNIFFPFVMMWGGVAQFIAGIKGFQARDNLVTVLHTMWGSFYIAAGLVWFLQAASILPGVGLNTYFPEFASWGVVLMVFTYICTVAALGRDLVLVSVLATQAFGATLAVGGWYGDSGSAVKAAAYIWMLSSLLATYRVAAFLFEENLGKSFLPIFRTRRHTAARAVDNGAGEPGVKRGEYQVTEGTARNDTSLGSKNRKSYETTRTAV